MRVLLVLPLAALLLGCLGGGAQGVVLLVADDLLAVHGPSDAAARADLGPHCAHVVARGDRLVLRYDLAEAIPAGVLVRAYNATGSSVDLVGAGEGTGHVALSPVPAEVRSPLDQGPLLATARLEGTAVRLGDTLLRPGERTSLSFSYQVEQEGRSFDVEETLTLQHRGVVPVTPEQGLLCM